MKAITFETFGGPEVLQVSEVPVPEVRPADLLVRVHAAGVNRADLTHRTGGYGLAPLAHQATCRAAGFKVVDAHVSSAC